MDDTGTKYLLTVEQAAQFLQMSQFSIRSYVRQDKLKAFRTAGFRRMLVSKAELFALLKPANSSSSPRKFKFTDDES